MWYNVGVNIAALIIIFLTKWIYRWRNPKCKDGINLPPGSSGLPLIGETLELVIPCYSFDLHPFIKKRIQRYGPLFRTNVAGRAVIVSADQEFNHFLFQQEDKLVVRNYLDLFEEIFKQREHRPDGPPIHKYLRSLILNQFGAECIKKNLMFEFEKLVHRTFQAWSLRDCIDFESASVAMFGEFGAKQLYSYDKSTDKFTDQFINISTGAMSFPLYLPGTKYYKCLKDKEKVLKLIGDLVKGRLAAPQQNINEDDLLSKLIKDINFLSPEGITQLLFSLSFTTFQSTPSVLALALKFISDNPAVLQELIAEHEEILRKRENLNTLVTWEEYRSMTFTLQVINETLRLGNSALGLIMRKAIKDIKVNGYTIPAGWNIMAYHIAMHLDPNLYEDPLKFNPWRWKDVKPEFISKNLRPFGGGIKQCAGSEFSRVSMSIFLHVLVTKYRWSIVKGGDIIQDPILHFKNGLHISISERG